MAEISVGAAIGAGFGLIRRRPVSVLIWGAVVVGLQLLALALFAPLYVATYGVLLQGMANGAPPDIAALQSPQIRSLQGFSQLFNLAQMLVTAVVYCAVFRAVLHPDRSAFAYLRLGAPEFFVVVLIFAGFIALFVALLILVIPTSIFIGVTVAVTHGGGAAALIMLPIIMLAILAAAIFIGLRFAFVGPMMVEDGKFHLFESWSLTRGRVLSLFLIGLSLVGVFLVLDVALFAVLLAAGAVEVQSLGGLGQAIAQLRASPMALAGKLAPLFVTLAVVETPVAGCVMAISAAPWARAYRDLLPDAAHVFA